MRAIPLDLQSLRRAYESGTPATAVIEQVIARIAAIDDPGIFIHLPSPDALRQAARDLGPFDASKPLWGVPFAVKDNIDVAGMPTSAACPAFTYTPDRDAHVVAKLRAAGAIVIGKTNLDQFATGLVGVRTPYPIPRNAMDATLVPGGSSSGSAIATAQGIVSFALGTDTAGSGRVPAGLNNIVGLKPSVGALSTSGLVPACRTLDCVSIFALSVDDAYAVFGMAAGHDPQDCYSRAIPVTPLRVLPASLTIGVPAPADRQFFGDDAMERGFDDAIAMLRRLGATPVELPFSEFFATAELLYGGAWVAERYAAIRNFYDTHEADLHPVTRTIIGGARALSAADAFHGLYALEERKTRAAPLLNGIDALCVPTAPRHYTLAEVEADPIGTNSRLGTYTNFVNLLDMCGIAVPTGLRADGRPMSVTLLAGAGEDATVAAIARAVHSAAGVSLGASGWTLPPAPGLADAPANEAFEIAVVGAHLSGMPLNHQLTGLDARLHRTTRTKACYRLYALAGQSVPKPGLVRCGDGEGVAVEVEVWRMEPEAFGRFVDSVPSPMAIGTVLLEDGTSPKGFLVEPCALAGAIDISRFAGWRAYVREARQSA